MASTKRTIGIHFQVDEKEREMIKQRMEQAGIKSLRAYMLKMATDGQIIHLEVTGVREMNRLLSNATNNINQIARRVNETGNFYAADMDDLREKYEDIWGQVKVIMRKIAAM